MRFKRVIRRWMVNGLGVVLVLLLILELTMAIVVQSYYYQQVQNNLYTRAKSLCDIVETYINRGDFQFRDGVHSFVEEFPEKEMMELQFISASGKILASSTGFIPETDSLTDFQQAIQSHFLGGETRAAWVGKNATGEKVSAVTVLVFENDATLCGAVRCVTAMETVDQQIVLLISVLILFGIAVLFFVVLSSSYFISTILKPLMEIGNTAKKIAQGDYSCRIEKQFDDEIGELCDTVNDMAEEISAAGRLQNEFIRSVSHELRTPLTAIKGWSDTLREDGLDDKELAAKGLEIISGETDRLSHMVEELLDFSRIQQAVKVATFEKLDVFAEVEETAFLFKDRAHREGLELQCVCQEELPPIRGDKARLKQVFSNILDNAIKYSREYGFIRVEAACVNDTVQIVFSDNGIGISAAALPNVKNKFYRANNQKPGSGIGLAVADEIIQAHGGSLELESAENKGTVVTVTLPITKGEES